MHHAVSSKECAMADEPRKPQCVVDPVRGDILFGGGSMSVSGFKEVFGLEDGSSEDVRIAFQEHEHEVNAAVKRARERTGAKDDSMVYLEVQDFR
jgi:hypothetical protein